MMILKARFSLWRAAILLGLSSVLLLAGDAPTAPRAKAPRLVVVISIDQFRADYLTRYEDLFAPPVQRGGGRTIYGGFEYLKMRGAWFAAARHDHFPLFTGPGHAVELTGAHPYKSGIIGNSWYDRYEKKGSRYCVEDLTALGKLVGNDGIKTNGTGISPRTLEVSTVGDELRIATGGRAKVWGLALKDRAAVLMAGHLANGVIWFDESSGDWESSRYYCTNGTLPGWVVDLNTHRDTGGARLVDSFTNRLWRFEFPKSADRVWTGARDFSHSVHGKNYKDFSFSPFGNEFVFTSAQRLVEEEKLGADEVPDLLAINLSSNDYVGHKYGPDSAEMLDITVRTDRQLGRFFTWLDQKIGLSRVLLVVTSDHGVSPAPMQMKEEGHFDADIGSEKSTETDLNKFVKERFGFKEGQTNAVKLDEFNVYIQTGKLAGENAPAKVHAEVAEFLNQQRTNGYYYAYTREQILAGNMPHTDIAERVMKGFHPVNSGDVVLVPKAYWVQIDLTKSPYKTSHGSPYAYDTAVPLLLAGTGIHPVRWTGRVSTMDLAPTLSYLLGVLPPSGSEGNILSPAVDRQ